jgi:probable selenium-dependent hydroxylase accessory protein YqeC
LRRIEADDLASALGVGKGDLVTLVGGGGKTSLLYRLAVELFQGGLRSAAATTTKIAKPQRPDPVELLCGSDYGELAGELGVRGERPRVIGKNVLGNGKVEGVPPEWCDRLLAEGVVDALVVEADGAARKPLKAPEAWEPVVPDATTVFVAVVGLSCLGRPLDEETVFRSQLATRVAGVALGSPVTPEVLARLLLSAEGLLKGKPKGARAVAFLNQADGDAELRGGRVVAEAALKGPYERVIAAALRRREPIREVWAR